MPGFTPAGRRPHHSISGHVQAAEPTLEELCRLPGLRLELPSGAIVTSDGSGVPSLAHGNDPDDPAARRGDGQPAIGG